MAASIFTGSSLDFVSLSGVLASDLRVPLRERDIEPQSAPMPMREVRGVTGGFSVVSARGSLSGPADNGVLTLVGGT